MSTTNAGQWVKFFNASGIPSPAAATYAHIFVENRIQTDMLMDLNKEYLMEMGITLMGDIIAILRHAKTVSDQSAREKILSSDMPVPIAAIAANPQLPPERKKIQLKSTVSSTTTSAAPVTAVKPRRVLPEHEGKYKIKLPSGTTERSKQILAKQAKLYSDREAAKQKANIFERLERNSATTIVVNDEEEDVEETDEISLGSTDDVKVKITGLGSKKPMSSSSIFSRLGGKSSDEMRKQIIKPILKNTAKNRVSTLIKPKPVAPAIVKPVIQQKVILVKKVPIKIDSDDDMDDDDNDRDIMCSDDDWDNEPHDMNISGGSEKFVKFASTAEVREIAPRRYSSPTRRSNFKTRQGLQNDGTVRSRLGANSKLHTTKKFNNFKATSPNKLKNLPKMKADELVQRMDVPVHKRLGGGNNSKQNSIKSSRTSASSSQLTNISKRLGNVNIRKDSGNSRTSSAPASSSSSNKVSKSVFSRLGYNS